MHIIKIAPSPSGAHNDMVIQWATPATFPVPDGWAILPDGMDTQNFPFGTIAVDDSTPPVVTSWTAGEVPPPEPEPEPEPEKTVWDELDEAYREGVNAV